MSSKQNDRISAINRENYEEYFLLFIDNELNSQQVKMVHEFLDSFPEMKLELDLLQKTRLPDHPIIFDGKESLRRDGMQLQDDNEGLLLYLDNELNNVERQAFEKRLNEHKELRLAYQILLKTKLDATEEIKFFDKKTLYKKTDRTIPFIARLRIAVLFILMVGSGLVYFFSTQLNKHTLTPVGQKNGVPEKQLVKIKKEEDAGGFLNTPRKINPMALRGARKLNHAYTKMNQKATRNLNRMVHNTPVPQTQSRFSRAPGFNPTTNITSPGLKTMVNEKLLFEEKMGERQPIIKNIPFFVTSTPAIRNTNEASPLESLQKESVVTNTRKGNFKSFLRKATRMIEKRTGIDPSNNNEEILIGAVAIKIN
ncbi:MAG: hypothetical protein NVS9B7_08330 [Flavisolibacter sp.]